LAFERLAADAYTADELALFAASRRTPERARELLEIDEWVAVGADGALVGAAGWSPQPDEAARIRRVWVHPDNAGCGLGTELVRRAEARASAEGATRFVVCSSKNAVGFYRRLGFEALRPAARQYGDRFVDFVWMAK
jgi:putative acetyltransferase